MCLKISRFLIVFNKIERIFQLYGQSMWQRKHDIASPAIFSYIKKKFIIRFSTDPFQEIQYFG